MIAVQLHGKKKTCKINLISFMAYFNKYFSMRTLYFSAATIRLKIKPTTLVTFKNMMQNENTYKNPSIFS